MAYLKEKYFVSFAFMKVMSTLNFGSFDGKLMFISGYTFDEICEELKKQKCNDWLKAFKKTEYLFSNDCKGFSSIQTLEIKGQTYYYNFLHLKDEFDFSDRHHAILSHELIHACTHQLYNMFDIVRENEAFAYTHTHLLTQCYQVLRNKKSLKK